MTIPLYLSPIFAIETFSLLLQYQRFFFAMCLNLCFFFNILWILIYVIYASIKSLLQMNISQDILIYPVFLLNTVITINSDLTLKICSMHLKIV